MENVKQLRAQLLYAGMAVLISAVALASATYAWYVANNTVKATTSTISAMVNGFVLQINDAASGAAHGSGVKSIEASLQGGILSPASSDNMSDWYVMAGLNDAGKIDSYQVPEFDSGEGAKPGQYTVMGAKYFAFLRSDYIVYTVSETGFADVYLEDDGVEAPVIVTTKGGDGVQTFTGSLRVAITTESVASYKGTAAKNEQLRVVYAVENETGKGNDAAGIDGWTSVQKSADGDPVLKEATYQHIWGTFDSKADRSNFTSQNNTNWVATKSGDNYTVPANSSKIASQVGYDGVIVHVYIWLEGTDADCINGKAVEDDPTLYDVTVKLAGVATSAPAGD